MPFLETGLPNVTYCIGISRTYIITFVKCMQDKYLLTKLWIKQKKIKTTTKLMYFIIFIQNNAVRVT